ncbi:hypothetical protein [Sphingomonas japonica]|uniref:Uncharacterized protein n=1 Tax=Sphingomonas japonica TaxID=511662 RepID=A0ABX0TZ44_9SPHN|nr:hypothetical protein [Sphingomonas japonica]NIJ23514.1 hypothetical protein [Sphingomonas japonica]
MNWTLLVGSLGAILALAGTARWLGLGGIAIADDAQAIAAAQAAVAGFEAIAAQVDREGRAALVEGADGSAVVLKAAGARIAARHLQPPIRTADTDEGIVVETGDRWFGYVAIRD